MCCSMCGARFGVVVIWSMPLFLGMPHLRRGLTLLQRKRRRSIAWKIGWEGTLDASLGRLYFCREESVHTDDTVVLERHVSRNYSEWQQSNMRITRLKLSVNGLVGIPRLNPAALGKSSMSKNSSELSHNSGRGAEG